MLFQIRLDEPNLAVDVEAEKLDVRAILDLSVELLQLGKLGLTGAAPCRPQIDEKRFASQIMQAPGLSFHIFQIKPGKLFLGGFPASFGQFLFCSLRAQTPDGPGTLGSA